MLERSPFSDPVKTGLSPFTPTFEPSFMAQSEFKPPPPPPSPERVAFTVVGILVACIALVGFTIYLARAS